jgi:hypothetical protein
MQKILLGRDSFDRNVEEYKRFFSTVVSVRMECPFLVERMM